MEQEIKQVSEANTSNVIAHMKEQGYYVKQIAGTGNDRYVWVLFERNINNTVDSL